ncbi:hypothetical protein LCGC14_0598590 [marine sediment metagenome]|uniref:Uncharacterized protein n=1 Tax=marine sediment metagenome TaxID=412755 RepID=A0A0F9UJT1_9ZZZZ
MPVAAVTENKNSNVDVYSLNVEIVQFTTATSGDFYDCRKLSQVDAAFAAQGTTDGVEIQCSWALKANGQPRVTLTLETGNNVTGTLTIYGRP